MGYMHIDNLYKNQKILEFPECYALEKIHGTSAHVRWVDGQLGFHRGSAPEAAFLANFDQEKLSSICKQLFDKKHVTLYGEAYGGNVHQGTWRYGPKVRFVVFDVKFDDEWLKVPQAELTALRLNLEFVHYVRIPTKLSEIDKWRDATSEQAVRNGVTTHDGEHIRREGVVLRTIDEVLDHRGNRIVAKHKRAEERETKTERVVDTQKLEILKGARVIAEEWVIPTRLQHVIDKLPPFNDMTAVRGVISAMIEDVEREGAGEFETSQTVRAEIGKRTAQLVKQHLNDRLQSL